MNKYIFLGIVLISMFSCVSQKRCMKKFPPVVTIDTVIKDTTIYRDTIIYKTLPGDTITKTDTIIEVSPGVIYASVEANTALAYAKSWIENNKLKLLLIQKDSVLAFKLDSAIIANHKVETITETKIHEVKFVPKVYKWAMGGFFVFFLAFILLIVIRKVI